MVTTNGEYTATLNRLRFVIERDELDGGWVAYCPEIPGCAGQGETETESLLDAANSAMEIIKFRVEEAIRNHQHESSSTTEPHEVSVAL